MRGWQTASNALFIERGVREGLHGPAECGAHKSVVVCRCSRYTEPVKCVLVGEGWGALCLRARLSPSPHSRARTLAAGKTALLMALSDGRFPDHIPPQVANVERSVEVDGRAVRVAYWDTHERLRVLAYPETDVFAICFSVTSPGSLDGAREKVRWRV